MAKHNDIGIIGESLAVKFMIKKDFKILDRNYRKKWGEIDIISQKDSILHFVEVKTVTRKSYNGVFEQEINNYRPEENLHPWKIERLKRTIQSYLIEKYENRELIWQFDLVCIFLDPGNKVAKARFIENIIL
jgi:putative endonuclease